MQKTPTGPVRGDWPGVAAIDYDGARYCLDCAATLLSGTTVRVQYGTGEWDTADTDVVQKLIDGEIQTLGSGGVVLKGQANGGDREFYCGMSGECPHAVSADAYGLDHSEPVGVLLDI